MAIYNKNPLSFAAQLATLKSRGLVVQDENAALRLLEQISYYRLSAYFVPFQKQKDTFDTGCTLEKIVAAYSFDRELRLLVFDCIERIEVAIRTRIIYTMALNHQDSHWQDNPAHFVAPYQNKANQRIDHYNDLQNIISKSLNTKHLEAFIKHYKQKYTHPSNPPSWMCIELLTMGELSHLYKGLASNSDKKNIADFFDVHTSVLASWLHSLTYIRNICAHHSRLWNRDLAIEPVVLQKPKNGWIDQRFEQPKRVFYLLCVLQYLLKRASSTNDLPTRLETLFTKYPNVPIRYIGLPSDGKGNMLEWQKEPLWRK